MNPLTPQAPPVTAAQISDAWIDTVATILRSDGHTLRAGAKVPRPATAEETKATGETVILVDPLTIESQLINTPDCWRTQMLEHSGYTFATVEDRDAVLDKIQRRAAIREFPS